MAAKNLRRRYWISILMMLVIVGGIWAAVGLGCTTETIVVDGKNVVQCKSPMKAQLGLDLQGGISVVLAPKGEANPESLDKAVDIIRQRVDALGVAEPDISRQGNNILVEIPGVKDRQAALDTIGKTAELRMRTVTKIISPGTPEWAAAPPLNCLKPFETAASPSPSASPKATATTTPKTSPTATVKPASPTATGKATPEPSGKATPTPTGTAAPSGAGEDDPDKPVTLCARVTAPDGKDLPESSWEKLELGPARLVGSDIADARGQLAGGGTDLSAVGWEVTLNLTGEGAKKFEKVTGELACNPAGDPKRQFAIVLDGIVESHPQMGEDIQCNTGIAGGTAVITGNFTEKDAKNLALVLRFGALPIALEEQETNEISPTLGKDSLRGGLLAGAIGLALTLIYVVLFYRILGFLIWFGLLLHAGFTVGVVIILGNTAGFALTLAGIAGLIVSVGIAADSFIVYFERLKDEVQTGKSIRASVDRAWSSAWRTIVAADLVTALAATALYVLAVGSVRGFALMLGLSTALDLFISYLVMHPAVWLLAQTKFFNESKRLGIKRVVGETAGPSLAGGQR